jgi:DNA primase
MGFPSIGFGGSSPSAEQLEDLLDLGNKGCTFVVLPDNDETGRAKARETVERLYPYARLASPLEEGKDAADLFAAEGLDGRGTIEALVDGAPDALDLALADVPDRGREKIRHLKERVLPLVMRLPASEQQAVIKDVAGKVGLSQENVRQALAELQAAEGQGFTANED